MGIIYQYKITESINGYSESHYDDTLHYSESIPEEKQGTTNDFDDAAAFIGKHSINFFIDGKNSIQAGFYDTIKRKKFEKYTYRKTAVEIKLDELSFESLMKRMDAASFIRFCKDNGITVVKG